MNTQPFSQSDQFECFLSVWVFLYELCDCEYQSHCRHLNFRYRACFEEGVCRFTLERVCDMIRIHSQNTCCKHYFILAYFGCVWCTKDCETSVAVCEMSGNYQAGSFCARLRYFCNFRVLKTCIDNHLFSSGFNIVTLENYLELLSGDPFSFIIVMERNPNFGFTQFFAGTWLYVPKSF